MLALLRMKLFLGKTSKSFEKNILNSFKTLLSGIPLPGEEYTTLGNIQTWVEVCADSPGTCDIAPNIFKMGEGTFESLGDENTALVNTMSLSTLEDI